MRAKLREIKESLRRCMHRPIPEQGKWLGRVVRGYFNYHAVPTTALQLRADKLSSDGTVGRDAAAQLDPWCEAGQQGAIARTRAPAATSVQDTQPTAPMRGSCLNDSLTFAR
jgi:hypothetical protein